MPELHAGDAAPLFSLPASGGKTIQLQDYRGKVVVLYFYPKDDTPGCTTEACGFRDLNAEFEAAGAAILGISPDSAGKHDKFAAKHHLQFPLLADENHAVAEQYGVWAEKKMYGRTYFGIVRTTFVIDGKGAIRKIYPNVKVAGHMEEVLAYVQSLS